MRWSSPAVDGFGSKISIDFFVVVDVPVVVWWRDGFLSGCLPWQDRVMSGWIDGWLAHCVTNWLISVVNYCSGCLVGCMVNRLTCSLIGSMLR